MDYTITPTSIHRKLPDQGPVIVEFPQVALYGTEPDTVGFFDTEDFVNDAGG